MLAPGVPRVCGLEGITAFYWNNGDSQTITLDIKGDEVSGTAQEVSEMGTCRVIDDEGTGSDMGKFIAIYRYERVVWKVHREIRNSDAVPATGPDSTAASG